MTEKENSTKDGYIDDDVAIAHKKVGDSPNIGIVKDGSGYVLIHGKPSFIVHPLTGKRVRIKDIFESDRDTKCPKCGEINGPGVTFRTLGNNELIYECPKCKHYTFCKVR